MLQKIEISENSELRTIGTDSFYDTKIQSLFIPEKVEEIGNGFGNQIANLNEIIISPNNRHFKYSDETKKIIIGKSDINSDDFDRLIFACRRISDVVKIPSYIKYIDKYAFESCKKIESFEIPENSQIQKIGRSAFSSLHVRKFKLPKSIEKVGKSCFSFSSKITHFEIENDSKLMSLPDDLFLFCNSLQTVEIPDSTNLQFIDRGALKYTSINRLNISVNVREIEENWCENAKCMEFVSISPKNRFFKYADKNRQMIVYKNDDNNDFDHLFFANRNIKSAVIPASIRHICAFSFMGCGRLKKIEFQENSMLRSIGGGAFKSASIACISIPKNVVIIGPDAFKKSDLIAFEFTANVLLNDCDIFTKCDHLKLASFPNVKKLTISEVYLSEECVLFTSVRIEIQVKNSNQ